MVRAVSGWFGHVVVMEVNGSVGVVFSRLKSSLVCSGRRRWSNSGSPSVCVMAEKRTGVSCLLLLLLWVVVRIGGFGEVVLVGVSAKRGTWGEFEHQERTERLAHVCVSVFLPEFQYRERDAVFVCL